MICTERSRSTVWPVILDCVTMPQFQNLGGQPFQSLRDLLHVCVKVLLSLSHAIATQPFFSTFSDVLTLVLLLEERERHASFVRNLHCPANHLNQQLISGDEGIYIYIYTSIQICIYIYICIAI